MGMGAAAIRIAHEEAGTANEDLLINDSAFASKLAPTSEHHPDALRRAAYSGSDAERPGRHATLSVAR
ncbi:hypothetical protein F4W70_09600 [Pseudomonas cannabina]|nr:hypothetical protein F4W70_09600 [Pseudomonas cannabina]